MARNLPGYGEVVFPHCACDSRKYGRVIISVGASNLKLNACTEDGVLQVIPQVMDSPKSDFNHSILNAKITLSKKLRFYIRNSG